jgi:hypothetical protein
MLPTMDCWKFDRDDSDPSLQTYRWKEIAFQFVAGTWAGPAGCCGLSLSAFSGLRGTVKSAAMASKNVIG